ncbi:RNA recognition motif domain-containing protein [Piscirickettsia salmonis]|nr:RNA-binding protein [Piscirickettsia salmonis]
MFSKYGEVISARVITDRDTGRSKGFAFVEFQTQEQAQAALELDGKDSGGRNLKVNMAKPQEKRQNSW